MTRFDKRARDTEEIFKVTSSTVLREERAAFRVCRILVEAWELLSFAFSFSAFLSIHLRSVCILLTNSFSKLDLVKGLFFASVLTSWERRRRYLLDECSAGGEVKRNIWRISQRANLRKNSILSQDTFVIAQLNIVCRGESYTRYCWKLWFYFLYERSSGIIQMMSHEFEEETRDVSKNVTSSDDAKKHYTFESFTSESLVIL